MHKPYYSDSHQREIWRVVPELIRARELLLDLVWKDLRARYSYAFLGFAWAVLDPLLMTLILTFVFSMVLQADIARLGITTGREYAAFILVGIIPWQFLASTLAIGTRSLVDNSGLIGKVYFPREVVPLAVVGDRLVNLVIGVLLLVLLFAALVHLPGPGIFFMVALLLIEVLLVVGLVLILSCSHVFFRDVAHLTEVALFFGFYATPVFYSPEHVQKSFPTLYNLYMLNPMACLVTCYRDLLWHNRLVEPQLLISPVVCAVGATVLGLWMFRRYAPHFSDNL